MIDFAPEPEILDLANLDEHIAALPNTHAVFMVEAGGRSAYLAKTSMLRRRLLRIFKPGEVSGRSLNLRETATRISCWPASSPFETTLVHYSIARRCFPDTYLKLTRLRMPAYVRLTISNAFPRTQVTTRLGGTSLYYGPFRTRAAAEQFETQMLDQFQLRRCQDQLAPHAEHPGCIYGEMNHCLRPCQQVASEQEYRSEVERVREFLGSNGLTLLKNITSARDRSSEEMNFEDAARHHKRLERLEAVLTLRDDLASTVDRLAGVAITPASTPHGVLLWSLAAGFWQPPRLFSLISGVSLERRLRELTETAQPITGTANERQEHLALLARWFYSSWRDGEWVQFPDAREVPYRKLARAISRVQAAAEPKREEVNPAC